MGEYVYACSTGGKCRQIMFEENGFPWDHRYPTNGVIQVITTSEKFNIPQWRGSYKCCTHCHLPLNLAEAAKANKLLGYKLEDVKPDNSFLELLNGF